jgi:hypothetical protein
MDAAAHGDSRRPITLGLAPKLGLRPDDYVTKLFSPRALVLRVKSQRQGK